MLASCKGLNEMPEFEASESFASFLIALNNLNLNAYVKKLLCKVIS